MPCKCKKIGELMKTPTTDIGPEDFCLICAQKHFLAARGAVREFGYSESEKNHDFAIEQLSLAIHHVQQEIPALAQQIRGIRHLVQYWQYGKIGDQWETVAHTINMEIRKTVLSAAPIPAIPDQTSGSGVRPTSPTGPTSPTKSKQQKRRIYIFSNVAYPEKNKITPNPGDMLVFLNKAESVKYYQSTPAIKMVYLRSQKENYGTVIPSCINQYVFDETKQGLGLPADFIKKLKDNYDWNYPIEEGKVKCATTGYMVALFLAETYQNAEIILVNFGYNVSKSTFRCPWHNWKFEAEQLKKFKHLYLEEGKK